MKRLLSVDVLRGLTIAFMILVNDPGDGRVAYAPLNHADWNGFTPTDLVFPTFLFLVGVSMMLSYARRAAGSGANRGAYLKHALWRAVLLVALGIVVNGFPFFPVHTLRFYGVLQRIAVSFAAGSVLLVATPKERRLTVFSGVLAACLVGYWVLVAFVPVPGAGLPGRDVPLLDRDANLVAWLDRHLMPGHLYEGTRDPEGLLSDLPAVGTLVIGMLTGLWLQTTRAAREKAAGLAGAGAAALLAGGLWSLLLPINKKMWTSSYVLWAAGWSLLLLAFFYWLCEVRRLRGPGWAPLLVFGRNAIACYVFSELLAAATFAVTVHRQAVGRWVYAHLFAGVGSPAFASLLYALAYVGVCWLAMLPLYRRGVFLKL